MTLDDVVAAAGVGKGTLFRRFGDKAGLAVALLDEQERTLQEEILTGPPPLGPGASPVERLLASVRAYVAYVADNTELVAMSQTSSPGARLRTGSHQFWRQHCEFLLHPPTLPTPGYGPTSCSPGSPPSRSTTGCTTRAGRPAAWPTPRPAPPSS
ncbi:MAG TPA: TetR/AcrR family transcriptional regulator [Jatrophihabitantaceae bacterium]